MQVFTELAENCPMLQANPTRRYLSLSLKSLKNFLGPMASKSEAPALRLKFPFTVGGRERVADVETSVERSLALVSFALPFRIQLRIPGAEQASMSRVADTFVYVFEFETVDEAVEWMEHKVAEVEQVRGNNVTALQKEMDRLMLEYEGRGKKKVKLIDEDGFEYYA